MEAIPLHAYDDEAARDLLRGHSNLDDKAFRGATIPEITEASERLLTQAMNLISDYGYLVRQAGREDNLTIEGWYCFTKVGANPKFVVHVGRAGFIEANTDWLREPLKPRWPSGLVWDRVEKKWLGAVINLPKEHRVYGREEARDCSTPGYPFLRESALETLMRAILPELRKEVPIPSR
ncbi:MAG: hypothetical protein Q8P18_18250 [Pseudomonadota bacterium]|nr:hypothetical protein [Pseudomonadota bacterium]